MNAWNPYAYVYVGFYIKNNWADDQYIRASLENSNPPFYMGQLTNWTATTATKSKCRKSSVFFKPTSEGDFKAMVVGQSTSRTTAFSTSDSYLIGRMIVLDIFFQSEIV